MQEVLWINCNNMSNAQQCVVEGARLSPIVVPTLKSPFVLMRRVCRVPSRHSRAWPGSVNESDVNYGRKGSCAPATSDRRGMWRVARLKSDLLDKRRCRQLVAVMCLEWQTSSNKWSEDEPAWILRDLTLRELKLLQLVLQCTSNTVCSKFLYLKAFFF